MSDSFIFDIFFLVLISTIGGAFVFSAIKATKENNKETLSQIKVVSTSSNNNTLLKINQKGNYVTIESKAVKTDKETKYGYIYQLLIPDASQINQAAQRCPDNTEAGEPTFIKSPAKQLIPDLELNSAAHESNIYSEEVISKTILTCK